ncbi:Asp23/Gls24 family envelope stress response protein [Pseudonocardiaceae bacterium YIM PH 21723]|nr:Asp23/Gls24 family envelope stress response protein [Pseudonocardiaceae bacterium YIM PH 21723]
MTAAATTDKNGTSRTPSRQENTGKGSPLVTDKGTTSIADSVVQKIAGTATREIAGVHDLGGGAARAFGAIRERIPGASASVGQGVSVEVGETQAAVDLELVVEYGVPIAELANKVRRNVTTSIERMTGLEVVEVNISVNDVNLPDDGSEQDDQQEARVK